MRYTRHSEVESTKNSSQYFLRYLIWGSETMVYDILIHPLFELQSHLFKYNIAHYMSIHTMERSKKSSNAHRSAYRGTGVSF